MKIPDSFKLPQPLLKTYPLFFLLPFALLVGADLYTKKLVTDNLRFVMQQRQMRKHYPIPPDVVKELRTGGKPFIPILGEGGKYIKFRLVFNDRFAFSLGPSTPVVGFVISLLAIIFLFMYRAYNPDLGNHYAWLMIFSGATGNLIDKMFVKNMVTREWVFSLLPKKHHASGVVDFVECIWFGWKDVPILNWPYWPTFNVADSLVSCGIVLLLLTMKFVEPADEQTKKA